MKRRAARLSLLSLLLCLMLAPAAGAQWYEPQEKEGEGPPKTRNRISPVSTSMLHASSASYAIRW